MHTWTIILAAAVGSAPLLVVLGRLARKHLFIPRYTILTDLLQLGTPRKGPRLTGRAVICGGSVAGLLAAAICAEHFESVLIVEPEASTNDARGLELSADVERRKGIDGAQVPHSARTRVPQYFAAHTYQPPVYMALKRLFPNLQKELDAVGIKPTVMQFKIHPLVDPFSEDHKRGDIHSGAPLTLAVSRQTFEILLRRLVKSDRPNVQFLMGTVTGVGKADHEEHKTDKVFIRNAAGEIITELAELVVDATGPVQAGFSKWLKVAGFPALPTDLRDEYSPNVHTVTGTYTIPPELHDKVPIPWGFKPGIASVQLPNPGLGEDRSMVAIITDRNQLQMYTFGQDLVSRPRSASDFLATLSDLAGNKQEPRHSAPHLFDLCDFLQQHENECKPFFADVPIGMMSWVKYHKASVGSVPSNFVAVGDAVMKVNPGAGSGCAKAVHDAVTLDACLRNIPSGGPLPHNFSSTFFRKQAPRIEGFWLPTKDSDYAFPATIAVKTESHEAGRFRRAYTKQLFMLCLKDRDTWSQFWHVRMFLAPPTDLFAPWIVMRLVREWFTSR